MYPLLECAYVHFLAQEKVIEDDIAVDPKYHRHFIQRRGQVRAVGTTCVNEKAYMHMYVYLLYIHIQM